MRLNSFNSASGLFCLSNNIGIECLPQTLISIHIFVTKCCRTEIFQTMNSVRSNNLSLKYQRFTPWVIIGIKKIEFVANTQFLKLTKVLAHLIQVRPV